MDDFQGLKTELTDDTKGLGYSEHANDNDTDNQWCADKLNEIGASNETVIVNSVSSNDILKSIIWGEVSGFNAAKISWINLFTYGEGIDPSDTNIKNMFQGIFAGCDDTLINLNNIAKRSCSRAEKLDWPEITKADIHNARII
jgi:hypothetical protein